MRATENQQLPDHCYLLHEAGFSDPLDEKRPNRLCISFSDVHFTDGSVGDQSSEISVWHEVFQRIKNLCTTYRIEELTIILAGDSIDIVRSAKWASKEVYPWERDHPEYTGVLRAIMNDIIIRHAEPPRSGMPEGFFYLLKALRANLAAHPVKVQTLVLLGNHDKDILIDVPTLTRFYQDCLNQPVTGLSDDYRQWIGRMYFGRADYFQDASQTPPWLPFYWGDQGFRLFVTHGQWRDKDNSRAQPDWQAGDGWNPGLWQKNGFAAFTEPCFGDSVAAGVLSGFIYRCKNQLHTVSVEFPHLNPEIKRLNRILDELDLYRPTYAAVARVITEIRRLRQLQPPVDSIRTLVENELLHSLHLWLSWDFVYQSASPAARIFLRLSKAVISVLKFLDARIELGFIYGLMKIMTWLQTGIFNFGDGPSTKELLGFPAFLEQYRSSGFRLYCEGHTHIPLQSEIYFKTPSHPSDRKSYTYINLGTWRNQIVNTVNQKFRRRDSGRMLCVLDLLPSPEEPDAGRYYGYFVEDILVWNDRLDRL
ncbi:MAG: hypothetical protein CTY18_08925 [Methylomonas sp.]|nr:MAG: hypothetical protein CTY18_08925 [Methylomonas sp.]